MGLDTTHDAWHGGYGGFNHFRHLVAQAAGIPLPIMEGYFASMTGREDLKTGIQAELDNKAVCNLMYTTASQMERLLPYLPVPWSLVAGNPLVPFLNHSDCEGEIEAEYLLPLAERLEELAPAIAALPGYPRAEEMAGKALQFAAGCRLAAEAGEAIGFH